MRYKPIRTRGGPVVQSGLDLRTKDNPRSVMTPMLGIYRGLVYNTYTPDDPENRRGQVECDVLLVRTHTILQRVQVLQRGHGINEAHGLWIPRASTRTLDSSELRFSVLSDDGQYEGPPTQFDNTDGDMVAVQFVEGDPDYPVITGALTHEQTNRVVQTGGGWSEGSDDRGTPQSDEYYVHHQGAEVRINADGSVLIDTVGAYADRATEDNSGGAGDVRVRVKEGQKLTIALGDDEDTLEVYKDGNQLRIDLGEDADEQLVLGNSFMSFFNNFLTTNFDVHTHPTGVGPSGVPVTAPATQMDTSLLSDLSKTKKT